MPTRKIPKNAKEYISGFPPSAREKLETIRGIIKKSGKKRVEESISYGMLAFKLDGKKFIHVGAFKNHISLFGAVPAECEADLNPFIVGKGTTSFSLDKPLPIASIRKLVKALASRNSSDQAPRFHEARSIHFSGPETSTDVGPSPMFNISSVASLELGFTSRWINPGGITKTSPRDIFAFSCPLLPYSISALPEITYPYIVRLP